MAKRLTFENFSNSLKKGTLPLESLMDYVELDTESPIPKLSFRPDALLDAPDTNFDVDRAIYKYVLKIKEYERFQAATFQFSGVKTVVAEGDSWFNLPQPFRPRAIADRIEKNRSFDMRNIAYWGHTLAKILRQKQHIKVLREDMPEFFMFSGGGNDLQVGITRKKNNFLYKYDPGRDPKDYLTKNGINGLKKIGEGYTKLLDEVTRLFPNLKVLCHGYDYPRPRIKKGKYIGKYLKKLEIPDDSMDEILNPVVNLLNDTIQKAIAPYPNVKFIDLRGKSAAYTWIDDMHPGKDGFRAFANLFEEAMLKPW